MKYIITFTLTFSSLLYAASETIPKDRTITEFIVYENLAVVRFSPSFGDSQNCESNSTDLIQLNFDDTTSSNKALLSTILAAPLIQKKWVLA